jgi:hypothetical protein
MPSSMDACGHVAQHTVIAGMKPGTGADNFMIFCLLTFECKILALE